MTHTEEINNGKITAIVSYILIVGVLIAMSMNAENKNKFASFHIKQAAGLNILFISFGLLLSNFNNPYILLGFWTFIFVLIAYGFITAINGQQKPVPIVGNLFQTIFKNL
ncbi:hypothetical protein [uncultured Flavobacterium sp.]|uniref:hypothetical protein n=1 Tax=uncultured Flavobacterium sp. TaxID=165435 RepID=UPI0030CA51C3|tara:strand:+ start:1226 stop:1555 length:330 start_codon:yes stop_codon:yes gene_type:complete